MKTSNTETSKPQTGALPAPVKDRALKSPQPRRPERTEDILGKPAAKPISRALGVALMLLALSISAQDLTTISIPLQVMTGSPVNRDIHLIPDIPTNSVVNGTNLVGLVPVPTVHATNGVGMAKVLPWSYTLTVDGWPRSYHINVYASTNVLNVVSLITNAVAVGAPNVFGLASVVASNSASVTITGNGTRTNPLMASVVGGSATNLTPFQIATIAAAVGVTNLTAAQIYIIAHSLTDASQFDAAGLAASLVGALRASALTNHYKGNNIYFDVSITMTNLGFFSVMNPTSGAHAFEVVNQNDGSSTAYITASGQCLMQSYTGDGTSLGGVMHSVNTDNLTIAGNGTGTPLSTIGITTSIVGTNGVTFWITNGLVQGGGGGTGGGGTNTITATGFNDPYNTTYTFVGSGITPPSGDWPTVISEWDNADHTFCIVWNNIGFLSLQSVPPVYFGGALSYLDSPPNDPTTTAWNSLGGGSGTISFGP